MTTLKLYTTPDVQFLMGAKRLLELQDRLDEVGRLWTRVRQVAALHRQTHGNGELVATEDIGIQMLHIEALNHILKEQEQLLGELRALGEEYADGRKTT